MVTRKPLKTRPTNSLLHFYIGMAACLKTASFLNRSVNQKICFARRQFRFTETRGIGGPYSPSVL
jgi:hypothetical protein